jgi:hypothetical protein
MCHRERVAWLSLGAMLCSYGPYFVVMTQSPPDQPLPDLGAMAKFAAASLAHALLLCAGHLWLRLRHPDDALQPADERDRAIDRCALAAAYYVLIAGVIATGCVLPFLATGWQLVNAAVSAIVLAELVHYATAVVCYRRGRHA